MRQTNFFIDLFANQKSQGQSLHLQVLEYLKNFLHVFALPVELLVNCLFGEKYIHPIYLPFRLLWSLFFEVGLACTLITGGVLAYFFWNDLWLLAYPYALVAVLVVLHWIAGLLLRPAKTHRFSMGVPIPYALTKFPIFVSNGYFFYVQPLAAIFVVGMLVMLDVFPVIYLLFPAAFVVKSIIHALHGSDIVDGLKDQEIVSDYINDALDNGGDEPAISQTQRIEPDKTWED